MIGSSDRTKSLDFSLLALDIETGQQINELWEEGASVDNPLFSPLEGDARLICTSSGSGFDRPLIWNALTGERVPLQLDDVPGSVHPQDWSEDGEQLLLCQVYQAQYQLYRYEVRDPYGCKTGSSRGNPGRFGQEVTLLRTAKCGSRGKTLRTLPA